MKKGGITAHCLVRNEENWIWYAINSVIDYVEKILVFDTGSTDNTVRIIKTIKSPKVFFEQKGTVNKQSYSKLRQEMLDQTKTTWFLVLDGDEIYPQATIEELVSVIKTAPVFKHAIFVGEWMCQGDVFHYSQTVENLRDPKVPKLSGYRLARAVRMLPGLHVVGDYGVESYEDRNGLNIAYWDKNRLIYIKNKFWHMSFLPRSDSHQKDRQVMMRAPKTRFVPGQLFPPDISYPEVFYKARPALVPPPWRRLTRWDQVKGMYYRSQNVFERFRKGLSKGGD